MFEVLVSGMLCWKLEGVAAAKFGSFGGLSEMRFLVARLLKDTGDVSAPTLFGGCPPASPFPPNAHHWASSAHSDNRIDNSTTALILCLDWRIA